MTTLQPCNLHGRPVGKLFQMKNTKPRTHRSRENYVDIRCVQEGSESHDQGSGEEEEGTRDDGAAVARAFGQLPPPERVRYLPVPKI